MKTAKQLLSPQKLLLLLPEHQQEYDEFRRRAKGVFPCELPEHRFRSLKSKGHISSEGLLYFERDWTPHLQPLRTARLRQTYWLPGVPILKSALRPVFEQLGIEWKRPPLQPLMVLAAVILFSLMIFALYVAGLQVVKFVELFRTT